MNIDDYWDPSEKMQVMGMLSRSVVGSPETVRAGLAALAEERNNFV